MPGSPVKAWRWTSEAIVDAVEWNARAHAQADLAGNRIGHGRELFALMRAQVGPAEQGACSLFVDEAGA